MNDFDLDRLGDVWRQPPDPAEMEALQRSADRVRRRARWKQIFDIAAAVVVSGVVLLLILSNPQKATLVVGGSAILLLLFGQRRQRRLSRQELRSLDGSAEEMLDQSIARIKATIRHTRISLVALPPAVALGIAFSYVVDAGGRGELSSRLGSDSAISPLLRVMIGVLVVVAILFMLRSVGRERAELERQIRLRDTFRSEREASAPE